MENPVYFVVQLPLGCVIIRRYVYGFSNELLVTQSIITFLKENYQNKSELKGISHFLAVSC
jgi:hypothetical protein